jgi:aspartate-semialdehyde dehydrogenase
MSSPKEAVRVAIAGASSLLGKELKLYLEESNFPAIDVRLLDEEFVAGTLTEAGGEPAVIETVTEESFERVRFAFFTGSPAFSTRHAGEARQAGALVIDLSGGLGADPSAKLWIPALDAVLGSPEVTKAAGEPQSTYVVPSAPSDAAISISAALASAGLVRLVVTALQPVSEHGPEAIEELESQVVKLLSWTRKRHQAGRCARANCKRVQTISRRPRARAGRNAGPSAGLPFARVYGLCGIQSSPGAR